MLLLLPTRTPAKRRNWHGRISDRRGQLTQSSDAIDGRIFRRATQLTRSHLGLSSSIRISYRVTQHGRISPSSSSIDALHFQIADSTPTLTQSALDGGTPTDGHSMPRAALGVKLFRLDSQRPLKSASTLLSHCEPPSDATSESLASSMVCWCEVDLISLDGDALSVNDGPRPWAATVEDIPLRCAFWR